MFIYKEKQVIDFIKESNAIEKEYSDQAVQSSLLAWDYLAGCIDQLSLKDILCIHEIMLEMINPKIAGRLRSELKINVSVGLYNPPEYNKVPWQLSQWIFWVNKCDYKITEDINRLHIEFEKIHPFVDGNGRVGRLIWLWMRQLGELPFRVIKEAEKEEYYNWFV